MVGRPPHPSPIGSADSADAEREKRSPRLDEIVRRLVHGFKARFFRGILPPHGASVWPGCRFVGLWISVFGFYPCPAVFAADHRLCG